MISEYEIFYPEYINTIWIFLAMATFGYGIHVGIMLISKKAKLLNFIPLSIGFLFIGLIFFYNIHLALYLDETSKYTLNGKIGNETDYILIIVSILSFTISHLLLINSKKDWQ
ncbi:MAG: hypothetical protein ACRCUP_07710 [Mycoplasmatales bacterium]